MQSVTNCVLKQIKILIKYFTLKETTTIGNQIGIDWVKHDPEQFRIGLEVELERGKISLASNANDSELMSTARIAMAHLNEFADYYDRLVRMKNRLKKPLKASRIRYAVDTSVDSIVDSPFTETYQSGYKQNIREDRKLILND